MRPERFTQGRLPMLVPLLLAWLQVAGCGQKGPLYLPDDRSVMQTTLPEVAEDDESTEPDEAEPGDEDPEGDSR